MTPTAFSALLASIGWTPRELSRRLGVHETRTRRWASGRYPIPPEVAEWLQRLSQAQERHGLPKGWTPPD